MKVAESKVSSQWATTIPSEIRPWLKVEKGESLEWHVDFPEEGNTTVYKISVKKREE